MKKPINILLLLAAALVGGVLVLTPPLRAADPVALACPNGQTVFLEGQAAPREALLVFMGGRPVGGGLSRPDGRFTVPLRPRERPGIYPVEVRLRAGQALVASYTCFVDVPLDAQPTPTATLEGPAPATAVRATPQTTPTLGRGTPLPTASPTPTGGTTRVPTAATAATAATATTATITATTTTTTTTAVEIVDIVLRDPAFPDDTEEYVQLTNVSDAPISIGGWRLLNATRGGQVPPYTFPAYTVGVDVTIAVFSAAGDNDLDIGDFYWDQQADIWRVGDTAELRDAQNRLVATLVVPQQ